jgi:hypothetical protein
MESLSAVSRGVTRPTAHDYPLPLPAPALRPTPANGQPATRDAACRFPWLTRPRRVLLVLCAVWVLNAFDLGYTLLEATRSSFVEINPLAARLLSAPPYVLILYKAALVVASSLRLLSLRRHRVVELGCWFLLAAYVYVGARWIFYYEDLLGTLGDPTVRCAHLSG